MRSQNTFVYHDAITHTVIVSGLCVCVVCSHQKTEKIYDSKQSVCILITLHFWLCCGCTFVCHNAIHQRGAAHSCKILKQIKGCMIIIKDSKLLADKGKCILFIGPLIKV